MRMRANIINFDCSCTDIRIQEMELELELEGMSALTMNELCNKLEGVIGASSLQKLRGAK